MAYYITDDCIACGTCIDECPSEAISYEGDMACINPDYCTECGTCAGVCPNEAIEGAIVLESNGSGPFSSIFSSIFGTHTPANHDDEEETSTSENETEYLNEVKDILSEGEISPRERRLLDKIRIQLGISEERAAELEASLSPSGVSAEEQEYMDELLEILKEGEISPRDQKFLDKLKKVNNISDLRACQLEKMVENNLCQGKAKYGSSDASCLKGISKSHS